MKPIGPYCGKKNYFNAVKQNLGKLDVACYILFQLLTMVRKPLIPTIK